MFFLISRDNLSATLCLATLYTYDQTCGNFINNVFHCIDVKQYQLGLIFVPEIPLSLSDLLLIEALAAVASLSNNYEKSKHWELIRVSLVKEK